MNSRIFYELLCLIFNFSSLCISVCVRKRDRVWYYTSIISVCHSFNLSFFLLMPCPFSIHRLLFYIILELLCLLGKDSKMVSFSMAWTSAFSLSRTWIDPRLENPVCPAIKSIAVGSWRINRFMPFQNVQSKCSILNSDLNMALWLHFLH